MTDASATSNLTTIEADAVKVFDAVLKRYVDIRSVELLDPDYVAAVEGALALKADQTAVDAALALKADQAATTAALALKADQTAVDAALALKRDVATSYSSAQVDSALVLKRDVATSYSSAQVDAALALKTDQATTNDSAVAWSSGSDPGYHYLETGPAGLIVRANGVSALQVLGSDNAPLDGKALFYRDVLMGNLDISGTVTGVTKAMVGLDQVDNTSDVAKPVSTAQQAALDAKLSVADANNTAYAWSSGAVGDGYHYLDSGTDALVLRTDGGVVAANVLGSVAGAQEGEVLFYKNVECLGALTLPGGTNVLTTLQGKQDAFAAQLPLKQLISFPSGELQLVIDSSEDQTMNNFIATTGITTPLCRVPAGASYLAIATSAGAEMAQFYDSGAVVIDSLSSGILTSTELQTGLVYAGTLESTVTTKTNLIEPRSGSTATAFSQNVNVVGELSCTTVRQDNVQAKTVATAVQILNHAGTALATFGDDGTVTFPVPGSSVFCDMLRPDEIRSKGTGGFDVTSSTGSLIAKFNETGTTSFFGPVSATSQGVSCGSVTTTGNLTVGGQSTFQAQLSVNYATNASLIVGDNGDGARLVSGSTSKTMGISAGPSYGSGAGWVKCTGGFSTAAVAVRASTNGVILNTDDTAWSSYSDLRLKNVIGPCMGGLARMDQLQPVMFSWKADPSNKPRVGVIAQEVQAVLPEAVDEYIDPDSGESRLTVRYTDLIPMMICAIRELKAKVEALEAQRQS